MKNKLNKIFQALSLLWKQPSLINKILEDENANRKLVEQEFPKFKRGLPEISFENFLKHKESIEVTPFAFLDGGSLVTDLALIKLICQKFSECSYFEIGTWRGESVCNAASASRECFTLNLSEEEMIGKNWDKEYIKLHGHFSVSNSKINHLYGNSKTFDFSNYKSKMDVIFVDGDHRLPAIIHDSKIAIELMKSNQSIIIWHDYKNSPEQVRWEVLRGILKGVPEQFHSNLFGVENTLCAVYYPYPVESKNLSYPSKPVHHFKINLELDKD